MNEDDLAFLAHAIVTGKANLSEGDKARLQELASRYIGVGDRVLVNSAAPGMPGVPPAMPGVVTEVTRGRIKVDLDTPTELQANGMTVMADEIVVDRGQVTPETPAEEPTT
jgi:hypothetical protein